MAYEILSNQRHYDGGIIVNGKNLHYLNRWMRELKGAIDGRGLQEREWEIQNITFWTKKDVIKHLKPVLKFLNVLTIKNVI